jgi:hypothetical protein
MLILRVITEKFEYDIPYLTKRDVRRGTGQPDTASAIGTKVIQQVFDALDVINAAIESQGVRPLGTIPEETLCGRP